MSDARQNKAPWWVVVVFFCMLGFGLLSAFDPEFGHERFFQIVKRLLFAPVAIFILAPVLLGLVGVCVVLSGAWRGRRKGP